MTLYESERKVMEVLWREGSLSAGDISRILQLDTGWNRNTTYTVINKCIRKGYIARSSERFICTALLDEKNAQKNVLNDVLEKYFNSSAVQLLSVLAEKAGKQEIKKMRKLLKNLE